MGSTAAFNTIYAGFYLKLLPIIPLVRLFYWEIGENVVLAKQIKNIQKKTGKLYETWTDSNLLEKCPLSNSNVATTKIADNHAKTSRFVGWNCVCYFAISPFLVCFYYGFIWILCWFVGMVIICLQTYYSGLRF